MVENKLVVALNNDGSLDGNGQITNINDDYNNTYVSKVSYCSKCLRVLGGSDDVVRDSEENVFCDQECRSDFWREIRRHYEEIMGNY